MRGATYGCEPNDLLKLFQSTRPMRGATVPGSGILSRPSRFQSTRPMRGATKGYNLWLVEMAISIHAPHAGRDYIQVLHYLMVTISIHAPHAGRDHARP